MSEDEGDLGSLTAAIAENAADPELRARRGTHYLHAGRPADVLADADAGLDLDPGAEGEATLLVLRAQAWLLLARDAQDPGVDSVDGDDGTGGEDLLVEAMADLDRCIALAEPTGELHLLRGMVLSKLRSPHESVADFRTALELGYEPTTTGLWLASAALDGDRPEEALDAIDAVIAAGGDSGDEYFWKGSALHALGNATLAIAAFDVALRHEPESVRALASRAQVWMDLTQPVRAAQDLSRALELEPGNAQRHLDRAEAWSQLGDECRADDDYGRSVLLQTGETMKDDTMARRKLVYLRLRDHFGDQELDELSVHERRFPRRVRADVQQALTALPESRFQTLDFTGLASEHEHQPVTFARISKRSRYDPVVISAAQYEDLDVGADEPVRCLVSGLWLLEVDDVRLAMLLLPPSQHGPGGHHVQIAVPEGSTQLADELFGRLESAVAEARCYRGKVLSLETCQSDYSGRASGIAVHRLPSITRDDVILPEPTLKLLERNVFDFIDRRSRLRELRMSTKKGLLFYGPPGTGKTHTIRYLASTLVGQTTLLITADQIALLDEYMILARLLQPAIVVIEDVDLVARDREYQGSAGTESLLNRLLNEMDGLRQDVEVLFILTTNRPEGLEQALASRPGRIDQAIEFPRPDGACRQRLAELYSGGLELSPEAMEAIVQRSEGASASFVRELMRRSAQFMLARDADRAVESADIEAAAREMIEVGGSLNRTLLGAG